MANIPSISTVEPLSFHAGAQSIDESKASSESNSQPYKLETFSANKTELTVAVEGTSQEQRRTAFPKVSVTRVTS